jgi:hypothetical protein
MRQVTKSHNVLHEADGTLQPVRYAGQPGSITPICARGCLPEVLRQKKPLQGTLRLGLQARSSGRPTIKLAFDTGWRCGAEEAAQPRADQFAWLKMECGGPGV